MARLALTNARIFDGFSLQAVSIVMGCGSLLGAIALLFVKFESTSEAAPRA